ncbi:MAG: glutamate racemase [Erysipelotrichaceae bacterium]
MDTKIGVCDSGLGGILVLKALVNAYPNYDYIFIGDQINAPYGDLNPEQIYINACKIINYFISININKVVIACNTICANAIDKLRIKYPNIILYDIIKPTIKQLDATNKNILVMATNATINTHIYSKLINEYYPNIKVNEVACPKLVPFIEQGAPNDWIQQAVNLYLKDYVNTIDTVILGCTHYPLIINQIYNCGDYKVLDSNNAIVKQINLEKIDNEGSVKIYTTKDEEEMNEQSSLILNDEYKVNFIKL